MVRPWLKATAVSVATQAAGGTEVVAAGRFWIASVTFFNSHAADPVDFELHDHATAATDPHPVRATLLAGTTHTVRGPWRHDVGIRCAASAADALTGCTVIYDGRSPHE